MSDQESEKFGAIKGVLIPNITMMFGVILFLRLGVLTGHAGLAQMLAAIGLSLVIMICTSFSIGALATNMTVGSGGVYYIISRTLGIEIGGAIGLAIYFAQLISIALTVAGFSVSICELFPDWSLATVELLTLTVLTLLSGSSASWSLRVQGGILALLLVSIASVLLGSPENLQMPAADTQPFYTGGLLEFWPVFAMFYPAMTGIEAGMALSGSLKDPGRSLYRGNVFSLLFVAVVYSTLAFYAYLRIPHEVLIKDPLAFVDFARWPGLVYAGIWGATLSSALGCLLGAPRMLQSMAEDGVVFTQLGAVYGRQKEPRKAMAMTYVLAAFLLVMTTMDQIIPMLAMICLLSYGLLNLVTLFTELMNAPSWRPALRSHWSVSFAGFALTVVAMLMTAPGWALVTLLILVLAHFALRSRNLESGFHDLRESMIFFASRLALYRLGGPTAHALTWHPQVMALVTAPSQQEDLVAVAHSFTRRSGLLTFATVVPEEWQALDRVESTRDSLKEYFLKQGVAGLVEVYAAPSTFEGYSQLVKAYGIGAIQPNTIVLEINPEAVDMELVDFIETCSHMQKNLLLLTRRQSDQSVLTLKRLGAKPTIDIIWKPDETSSFDLTNSFVTTLKDGFRFKKAQVTIRAELHDRGAEAHVRDYLSEYCQTNHLDAKVRVDLEVPPPGGQPGLLGFVPLRPLDTAEEELDRGEYLIYLREQLRRSEDWELTFFVTSYDLVDHRAIYRSDAETV